MKKLVALFSAIFLFGSLALIAQTQVPNGNFESWVTNYKPTSWNTIDTMGLRSCYKTTDVNSGSFAVKLRSLDTTIIIYHVQVPGLVTLGRINTSTGLIDKGIPFTDRPDNIRGYFKYLPVNTDTLTIGIYFWRYNVPLQKQDTMGGVQADTSATINTYTYFDLPIQWDTNFTGSPDSMNIIILASRTVQSHTLAYVDDLSFYYVTTGLETSLDAVLSEVYPNPARETLNLNNEANTEISLYSVSGQLILRTFVVQEKTGLDVSALSRGIYILKLQSGSGVSTSKVVLE
jgi:hypothetical protein